MDQFFRNLFPRGAAEFVSAASAQQQFGQFMQGAMDPQQQEAYRGPPPASAKAIRQLPRIQVTPEDLVDPNNRECCICLEENHLRDRVTRLPCAHIFHHACVLDWLQKHCTCPVCRYELPTENVDYERTRQERMRDRKPRYARYELERMSVKELRQVATRVRLSTTNIVDKSDFIQQLVESNRLDIIAAPEPVEYPLSLLHGMGVGELKRLMADAGVFFDPVDVVEKKDMVRIFVNSGRLVILPEEEIAAETSSATASKRASEESSVDDFMMRETRKDGPVVTTVMADSDEEGCGSEQDHATAVHSSFPTAPISSFIEPVEEAVMQPAEQVVESRTVEPASFEQQHHPTAAESIDHADSRPVSVSPEDIEVSAAPYSHGSAASHESHGLDSADMELDQIPRIAGRHGSTTESETADQYSSASSHSERFQERSIAELRALAREMHVDISYCIERPEMITRLVNASCASGADGSASPTSRREYIPLPQHFEQWSVSELRALANEVDVNLSNCVDRDDMVQTLVDAATARPHMANYIGALASLARLTVPQLRAVAREWQVNVWDCLEKEEIIHRLVTAGGISRG